MRIRRNGWRLPNSALKRLPDVAKLLIAKNNEHEYAANDANTAGQKSLQKNAERSGKIK